MQAGGNRFDPVHLHQGFRSQVSGAGEPELGMKMKFLAGSLNGLRAGLVD